MDHAGWEEVELIGIFATGELAEAGEEVDVEAADGFVGFCDVGMLPADDADAVIIDFGVEIEVAAAFFGNAGELFCGEFAGWAWFDDDGLGDVREVRRFTSQDGESVGISGRDGDGGIHSHGGDFFLNGRCGWDEGGDFEGRGNMGANLRNA